MTKLESKEYYNNLNTLDDSINLEINENPIFNEEIINIVKNKNYDNDKLLKIMISSNKIKLFVESLNYTFDPEYYKILISQLNSNEITNVFGLCCLYKESDIINTLMENGYKPKQNELEVYLYDSDDEDYKILKFCLENGMKLSKKNVIKLYSYENEKMIKILQSYNYVL